VKTAISIPDPLFRRADEAAKRLAMSRSELYARAVEEFLAEHAADRVREALDAVYGEEGSEIDPALAAMQRAAVGRGDG
jgi:metal-responsive CopG/Arc/MetJ family transcriptional regulator